MSENTTFLDGRLTVRQARGYRAGLDAVLLAAAMRPKPGAKALELGCGAGTALLCAAFLSPDVHFTGLEKHAETLGMAQNNVAENHMQDRVRLLEGSVLNPPDALRPDSFDHVFLNPPYFDNPAALRQPSAGKDRAFVNAGVTLQDWIGAAIRLTRARGYITLIQRADRLDDCLMAFHGRAGDMRVLPITPRAGEAAHRVLLRARRNVNSPLHILSPLVVHKSGQSGRSGWTPVAEAILRGHQPIDFT